MQKNSNWPSAHTENITLDQRRCVFSLLQWRVVHRRATYASNVDVNRNLSETRETPELYSTMNPVFNPEKEERKAWLMQNFALLAGEYGPDVVKSTVGNGQYVDPTGMFYGGLEVEEGPQYILDFLERTFKDRSDSISFMLVDLHTGLGDEPGVDTLLTPTLPPQEVLDFFGQKMLAESQNKTTDGYKAGGMLCSGVQAVLERTTTCASRILSVGQELGTKPTMLVLTALWEENMRRNLLRETGGEEAEQKLKDARAEVKRVFTLQDVEEQKVAIEVMQSLFKKACAYLQKAKELNPLGKEAIPQ